MQASDTQSRAVTKAEDRQTLPNKPQGRHADIHTARNLRRRSASLGDFSWHSQITNDVHPCTRSDLIAAASRLVLRSSFLFQNARLLVGRLPRRQLWQCQKQPCTKITLLNLGRQMSGEPGRSFLCRRNLNPMRCNNERTMSSGLVSKLRTLAIMRLRFSRVMKSAIAANPM